MPTGKRVMIEFDHSPELQEAAAKTRMAVGLPSELARDMRLDAANTPAIPGIKIDASFGVVQIPREPTNQDDARAAFDAMASEPESSSYIVRGIMDQVPEEGTIRTPSGRARVYSDPLIQPCLICPGSPALGTDADVEKLLCVEKLWQHRMDGKGVMVAVVDTGMNIAYLKSKGKIANFDAAKSWVPQPGLIPGSLPVNHGTMCAYDVMIAAPHAILLDVAVLLSNRTGGSIMEGLLSDAVSAYTHLFGIMAAPKRPGDATSMVVTNSWGMFHPSWDFPVGHPSNYSDNPNHPFNRMVGKLERAGADILFAAGNCGKDCPDGRCQGVTGSIYGANSHRSVLSIAGVDITKTRVGYSNNGPGRLYNKKPDVCGYTHFKGSGVYPADGGTSAATPVVAGVVAALRSRIPFDRFNPLSRPSVLRRLLRVTAEDRGSTGFDYDYGYGVVDSCKLVTLGRIKALQEVARGMEVGTNGRHDHQAMEQVNAELEEIEKELEHVNA
jgi:hypothetical protein